MTDQTQKERVVAQLNKVGYITRNQCLRNYISRLSAIILMLKNEGWEFKAEDVKNSSGTDYKYTVIKRPPATLF